MAPTVISNKLPDHDDDVVHTYTGTRAFTAHRARARVFSAGGTRARALCVYRDIFLIGGEQGLNSEGRKRARSLNYSGEGEREARFVSPVSRNSRTRERGKMN